ncbi:MAG: DUF1194 domain-containing protein [Kiloniellales bacterium]|nr:DUF1194 domain-containing protein [Kiloniellales bacterium]
MIRALSILLAAFLSLAAAPPGRAQEPVDLALVLAVDSSGSVSRFEFDLQMRGLAEAFRSPGVVNAIQSAAPNGIAVNLMQWSSVDEQGQAFGWLLVRDKASAERVASLIDRTPRLVQDGATAIGAALDYATRLLLGIDAKRRVIDVSGDGRDNQSGEVLEGRVKAVAAGITVNGLAILNEDPLLEFYYLSEIIGGAGAFVLGADDYDDFAQAMEIKLIKEISSAPVSDRRTRWPSYAARRPD